MSEHRPLLRKALLALAEVCDHATSRDNIGFSASTVTRGHEVALLPDRFWSDPIDVAAAVLVFKHEKQLLKAGKIDELELLELHTDFPDTDSLAKIPDRWIAYDHSQDSFVCSVNDRRLRSRLAGRKGVTQPAGKGKIFLVPFESGFLFSDDAVEGYDIDVETREVFKAAYAAADPDELCKLSDFVVDLSIAGEFALAFPYDEEIKNEVKSCGRSASFDGETKHWIVRGTPEGHDVIAKLRDERGFVLSSAAKAKFEKGPTDRSVAKQQDLGITLTLDENRYIVKFERFERAWVDALKGLRSKDRSYDPIRKAWLLVADERALRSAHDNLMVASPPPPQKDLDAFLAAADRHAAPSPRPSR